MCVFLFKFVFVASFIVIFHDFQMTSKAGYRISVYDVTYEEFKRVRTHDNTPHAAQRGRTRQVLFVRSMSTLLHSHTVRVDDSVLVRTVRCRRMTKAVIQVFRQ